MLKSYEAVYDHGELKWMGDRPPEGKMKVIVTVVEEETPGTASLIELLEQTRGCVNPPKSIEEIDSDIRSMRDEWEREWDR
jgi:hypothetical protein